MQLGNMDQLSFNIGKNFAQQQFCIFTGTEVKTHQSLIHIFMCIYIPYWIHNHTFSSCSYHISVANYLTTWKNTIASYFYLPSPPSWLVTEVFRTTLKSTVSLDLTVLFREHMYWGDWTLAVPNGSLFPRSFQRSFRGAGQTIER